MKTEIMFHWFSDPGHAWLLVPLRLVNELGIGHKITSYSYQEQRTDDSDDFFLYLEEDCDANTFVEAYKQRWPNHELVFEDHYKDVQPLKRLPRWQPAKQIIFTNH